MNNFFTKLIKHSRAVWLAVFVSCLWSSASMAQNITVNATVGATGTGYASIAAAFAAINAGTHGGVITVNVNLSETEPTTSGFLNASGAGAASYTSVTIQPSANGVVVSGAPIGNKMVLWLNGADNVTFNGDNPNTGGTNKNLTIQNTNISSTTATANIGLRNCVTPGFGCDNITIKNCIIKGCENSTFNITNYGIFAGLAANASATATSATTPANTAAPGTVTYSTMLIDNNTITNCGNAVYLAGAAATVFPTLVISNNIIGSAVAADRVTLCGILVAGSTGGSIRQNTIIDIISASASGAIGASTITNAGVRGIDIANVDASITITKNNIGKIQSTNAGGYSACGIHLGNGNNHIVTNNMIVMGPQYENFSQGTYGSYGIRIENGTGHIIDNNSISCRGASPGSGSAGQNTLLAVVSAASSGMNIRNNIFEQAATGNNVATYMFLVQMAQVTTLTMNNNAYYYTSVGTYAADGWASYGSGFYYADGAFAGWVAALQALGTATNENAAQHYIVAAPFTSASNLHIPAATVTALESGGMVGSTAVDIDGDARPGPTGSVNGGASAYDIGADESDMSIPSCAGAPTAGSITCAPVSVCYGKATTMTLGGGTSFPGAGITNQWQSSSDGGATWNNVAGQTGSTLAILVVSSNQYRCKVTCTTSGSIAYTPAFTPGLTGAPSVATIPYIQDFESWISVCGLGNDAPDIYSRTCSPYFVPPADVQIRREDDVASVPWTNQLLGTYSPAFSTGAHSARFHKYSLGSGSQGFIDFWVNLSAGGPANPTTIMLDYIANSGFAYGLNVSTDNGATFTLLTASPSLLTTSVWRTITSSTVANSPTTLFRIVWQSTGAATSDIGLDNLRIFPSCSGAPAVATIVSTSNPVCAGSAYTLTAGGLGSTGNYSYDWQSSTNGGATWTDLAGGFNIYASSQIVATTYRTIVTCVTSGLTTTSNTILINMNNPTYITWVGYTQNFESWISSCSTSDVPSANWKNTPAIGNGLDPGVCSWRRDDQGATGNWNVTYLPFGGYTPVFTVGAHSARFHSYSEASGGIENLDLYMNCTASGGSLTMTLDYINTSGTDVLKVYVSTDGGLTFTQTGATQGVQATWGNKSFTIASSSATTVIRLQGTSDWGTTDIGVDNLVITGPCAGAPTAGTAAATPATVCAGSNVSLSLTGNTSGAGITFQWQTAPDVAGVPGTWVNISGATNTTAITSQLANSYYRCVVTCVPSVATVYTLPTAMIGTTGSLAYGTIPYIQSFETWVNGCATSDKIADGFWGNVPATGNNSWRRDDDFTSAGWSFGNTGFYTPAFTTNAHSARFNTYSAANGLFGDLRLYLNCSTSGGAVGLSFDYNNLAGTDNLKISYSTDGGASYTAIATLGTSPTWSGHSYTINTVSTTVVIQFEATSDYGFDDIGLDNVQVGPTCSGTPTAGTINTTANPLCTATTAFTLSLTGSTGGGGIVYQWQSAAVNVAGSFSDIVGATNATYTGTQAASTWYRCMVFCTNGGGSATQGVGATLNETMVGAPSYAALPYAQSFEAWSSVCSTTDRPGVNWKNQYATGNTSWRRDDQGASAAWTYNGGAYTPAASVGSHSARFDTYSASFGTTGDLDLYVNATGSGGNIGLSFDFTNAADGDVDYMRLDYSTDGGTTFTTGLATLGQTGAWAGYNYLIPSSSATTIIRFHCYSDFGFSDMGLDNVAVSLPCSGTPVPGATLSSSGLGVCSGAPFTLSTANNMSAPGITFQWQSAPVPGTAGLFTNISGATTSTYTGSQIAETYYRCYVVCTLGGNAVSTALDLIMNPFYLCYGVASSGGFECITNVTLNTLNNTTAGCSAGNYSQQFATTSIQQGSPYTASMVTDGTFGNAITGVWIDYDHSGTFDPAEFVQPYLSGVSGSVPVNVPIGALTGLTGMRARSNWSFYTMSSSDAASPLAEGETEDYTVTITAAPVCAGIPAVSTTTSTLNPVAVGGPFTLNLTGLTVSGLLFQWQSSPNNTAWTDIPGETNTSYSSVGTVNTYYRCVVKCSISGSSTPSTSLLQKVNVYCVPTYSSGTGFGDYISNVVIEDNNGNTVMSHASGAALTAPYYTDNSVSVTNPDINAGSFFWLKANPGTWAGYIAIQAWVDWNGDGDFYDAGEWVTYQSSSVSYLAIGTIGGTINQGRIYADVPPLGAYAGGGVVTAGSHRLRLRYLDIISQPGVFPMDPCGNYLYGETEDYDLNLVGTCVTASNASQIVSFVPGQTTVNDRVQVNLSSPSVGGLKKFEYSSSPTFATVDGQFIEYGMTNLTTPSFVDNINLNQIYVRGVYQNEACGVDNTSTMLVKTACAPPLNFWTNKTLTPYLPSYVHDYITNVKINIGATNYLNNTSTYQNDGYQDFTYITANLDRSVTYTISTTCNGAGAQYSESRAVWLDYNGDGVFQTTENIYLSPALGGASSGTMTGTFSIPCGGSTPFIGDVVLRVMAVYDNPLGTGVYSFLTNAACASSFSYGEIEEYTVHLNELPDLTVSPASAVCAGTTAVLQVVPGAGLVTGGPGPFTWSWLPTTSSLSVNPTLLNQATTATAPINTFYTVTGTLSNGCTGTAVVPVTTSPLAGAVTPVASIVCSGNSKLLTAVGAAGLYQWQVADDNGAGVMLPWTNILGATNTTYNTAGFATPAKRYYRMLTLSPNCYDISSNTVTVEISSTPLVSVSNTYATSCVVSWTPSGGGNYSVTFLPAIAGSPFANATSGTQYTLLAPNTNYNVTVAQTSPSSCLGTNPATSTFKTLCAAPPAPSFGTITNTTAVVNIPAGATSYKVFYKLIQISNTYLSSGVLAGGSSYTIISQIGSAIYPGAALSVYLQAWDCPTVGLSGQAGPSVIQYLTPGTSTCPTPSFTLLSDCSNKIKVTLAGNPTLAYRVTFRRLLPSVAAPNTYNFTGTTLNYTVLNTPLPQVWEVYAVSTCGAAYGQPWSVMSQVQQINVKSGCNKINNLVLSHPTCHGFTATWNVGDCGAAPGLTGYTVFTKEGASQWNGYGSLTNVKSGNIWNSGATVLVYVRANSCNGSFGPASDIQTITTLSGVGCREEDQQTEENLFGNGVTNEFGTLSLFPNPNSGQFNMDLQMSDMTAQDVRVEIVNMLGQAVLTQITNINNGHLTESVDMPENITSGSYMVRVIVGDNAIFNSQVNISK